MPRSSRKKALGYDSDSGSDNCSRDVGLSKAWPCAVFLDEESQISIGKFKSPGFVKGTEAFLIWRAKPDAEPWMGFSIRFALGRSNDDNGFGLRYQANRKYSIPSLVRKYWLFVKFPRGRFTYTAEAVTKGHSRQGRVWKKKAEFTLLKVSLEEGSHAKIDGYCIPFANPGNVAHKWFNDNAPIADSKPLPELLDQRQFTIIVCATREDVLSRWTEATLPSPFSYPYGKQHAWDMHRYQTMLPKAQGGQFAPAWSFHDDNSHLAALTQSQVQGAIWLRNAADRIATLKLSALFIDAGLGVQGTTYYVIVSIGKHYKSQAPSVWKHLARGEILQLCVRKDPEALEWDAKILHHPQHIGILEASDLGEFQLVLLARRRLKAERSEYYIQASGPCLNTKAALRKGHDGWNPVSIQFRVEIADCKRKVDAVCQFHPGAMPSNPIAIGSLTDAGGQFTQCIPLDLQLKMSYHRDLLRGTGFHPTMRQQATGALQDANFYHWALPTVSILDDIDKTHAKAMMKEVPLADRSRLRNYLGKRPLGLGIITGGPGFGKTTALAVGALALTSSVGKVYCSAPSDVTIDNFAFRLDQITCSITNRLNAKRQLGNTTRAKCKLIVRGYRIEEEIDAFFNLLQHPQAGDQAVASSTWEDTRAWKLHLSLAFWLLAVLRSPSVRSLRPDDSPGLHQMRDGIDTQERLRPLLAVAKGNITWSEYKSGDDQAPVATVGKLLIEILRHADIVCTSPALSCSKQDPYRNWKNELAKGIAVDDAGSVSRPDLYSVWGNTLLPCLLAGHDCQLPPAVEGFEVQDKRGNYVNRLGQHGKISSLAFLEASGWPIFRLRTQLRMPQSLFELCDQGVFLDGHFEHRPSSDFEHSQYEIGRKLELYLANKYQDLASVVSDTFHEVFIHCGQSACHVNKITGSKQNPVQVQIALDFVTDFIKCKKANPSDITIISPEKANVDLVEHKRKESGYLVLSGMRPAMTIEGFQGCESKIVVAILGVTQKLGPKPLDDNRRLAAMLSRATCGLVIVGDINTLGKKKAPAGSSGREFKGHKRHEFHAPGFMLRNMLKRVKDTGRVIQM